MRINCPNCSASFQVADGALGATGRKVRCARCGNVWHAMPFEEPEPEPDFEAMDPPSPISPPTEEEWKAALNEDDSADEAEAEAADDPAPDPFDDPPDDGEAAPSGEAPEAAPEPVASAATAATKRGVKIKPKRKANAAEAFLNRVVRTAQALPPGLANAIAAGVVLVVLGVGFFMRESVVRTFPDFAQLYAGVGLAVNLRGLEFEDVRTYREVDGATPVLVVDGLVRTVDQANERKVPQLRFSLISSNGREVYAWTMDPARSSLKPGETFRFKSRLAAPPEAAVDLMVRFADRRGP